MRSHQECMNEHSSHASSLSAFSTILFFFLKAIKIDVWEYLIVILICVSDVEKLFMYSFAIHVYFFGETAI